MPRPDAGRLVAAPQGRAWVDVSACADGLIDAAPDGHPGKSRDRPDALRLL
jgi:hypothetical protein